jgi:hypothetical protein
MFIWMFVFIRVYWCPTRFPCQRMQVSLNSNTTRCQQWSRNCRPFWRIGVHPDFNGARIVQCLVCLHIALLIVVCPFSVSHSIDLSFDLQLLIIPLHVFPFGHYIDCQSSVCGFWLLLWYLCGIISIQYSQIQTFLKHEYQKGRW